MKIKIGDAAPLFCLPASDGSSFCLSDMKGKKVILYFYPRDMTSGCTTEACNFRDYQSEFNQLNAVIVGVSKDPIARHLKFIQKYQLPFLLLSDENQKVCEQYGVWQLKKLAGKEYMGIVRSTFIIDEEGKILHIYSKVRVKDHIEDILSFLQYS